MAKVMLSRVRPGSSNEDVRIVQNALIARKRKIPDGATGFFGGQTRAAYREEQRAQGFTGADADGVPGCASLTALGKAAGFTVDCTPASGSKVASPVPGHRVTFPFYAKGGYAWKPEPDKIGRHTGEDYAADHATPVVAVRSGNIAWSNGKGGAYGEWIGLSADNGHIYTYCHLSRRQVGAGARVTAGQRIGEVGNTGNSTGPHLHFEMSKGNRWAYGRVAKPKW